MIRQNTKKIESVNNKKNKQYIYIYVNCYNIQVQCVLINADRLDLPTVWESSVDPSFVYHQGPGFRRSTEEDPQVRLCFAQHADQPE